MKIAMIVHAYYLKDARVRRYAELLAKRGHEVDVLCLREGTESRREHHTGVMIYRVGVSRYRRGMPSYIYEYLLSLLHFFWNINKLYFAGRHYGLVHVHNMPNFLVFAPLIQKILGAKIILDIHDPMPEVFQSKYGLPRSHWLTRLLYAEEWLSIRFATAIITANHAFKDILMARGCRENKIAVVINAPDEKFESNQACARLSQSRRQGFHVLCIGTLAERYRVELGLRAVAKLKRDGLIRGLRFSIIPKIGNEGPYLDRLLEEAEALGLGGSFHLLEPVPHDSMPDVIKSADVVIYTPLPDVHMDIALSLKVPEAIAVGRPIVASRLSVHLRYFGEDALYLFEPGNVDDCAAKILEVFTDPDGVQRRVKFARAKLDEIAWAKQEAVYLDLVSKLIGTSQP